MSTSCCQVDEAIRRALRDGEADYAARGVRVELDLRCRTQLRTEEPVLDRALYTIFRGLPARLAPGATVRISTRDMAGGDVEIAWEAVESAEPPPAEAFTRGHAYGDLLELAIAGMETICRARSGRMEVEDATLRLAPDVRRRYVFLVPSLDRSPSWSPIS
ncbi:MAG TPA: hypothetical protein VFH78_07235 [Candidatus Thermoplasmatota archaeon]|nr:hypothetical protein [Candidatus Thermoplasmatota archaeon]